MATLTTLLRGTALRVQCGLPVRRFLPSVINFLVTGLAGLGSHVLGHFGRRRRRSDRRCAGGLNSLNWSWRTSLTGSKGDRAEKKDGQQKKSINCKTRCCWYTPLCWYTPPPLAISHDMQLVLFVMTLAKQSARVAREGSPRLVTVITSYGRCTISSRVGSRLFKIAQHGRFGYVKRPEPERGFRQNCG